MKNKGGFETGPDSPSQRFSRLWDTAKTGTAEEVGSGHNSIGSIRIGFCVTPDGTEQGAILRTMDIPYVTGSLRPACRVVEVSLDDGSNISVNDMSAVGCPEADIVSALDQLEQIVPTFR